MDYLSGFPFAAFMAGAIEVAKITVAIMSRINFTSSPFLNEHEY